MFLNKVLILEFLKDVTFLGNIDNVEDVLSNGDLFLLPSEKESFGLSALEAMSSSIPVISSNIGGLPELIVDGKSGFCCNLGDINEMSEKSLFVLDDSNLQKFKDNALIRAKKYSIENIAPEYVKFYNKIIDEKT